MGMKKKEINYQLLIRRICLIVLDIICIIAASILALLTRFEFDFSQIPKEFLKVIYKYGPFTIVITLIIFSLFRIYSSLWEYAGIEEVFSLIAACLAAAVAKIVIILFTWSVMPRSWYVLDTIYLMILIGATRVSYRLIRLRRQNRTFPWSKRKKVMIIGGGEAGRSLITEIQNSKYLDQKVVCIIDDDPYKIGRYIKGVKVVGNRNSIKKSVKKYNVQQIILTIPSANAAKIRPIVEICQDTNCELMILPGVYQLVNGEVKASKLRPVNIDDLLGRDEVHVNLNEVMDYVSGRVIMVTGGGGSIGSELCRQIAKHSPKQLIIFDIYENNAYDIQQELLREQPKLDLVVLIGSVRDENRINSIFEQYRPEIIYHAAAHKHVPLMEGSPNEAIKNNVLGTYNMVRMADKWNAKRFVQISTDKAVNPTNIMGASKRICEMIIQTYNKESNTEYVAVRFGNVLGSNGSVIPLFKKQIAEGGPVTVTHPEIIRYFMTIPEAVYVPEYTTQATFVVSSRGDANAYSNLSSANTMAKTFEKILKSNIMEKKICEKLKVEELDADIHAKVLEGTNMLVLSVTADTPKESIDIIRTVMDNYSSVSLYTVGSAVMDVLEEPKIPYTPDNPLDAGGQAKKGGLVAGALVIILLGLFSYMKNTIKQENEIEKKLDARSLGAISYEWKYKTIRDIFRRKKKAILVDDPVASFRFVESYKKLAAKVEYRMAKNEQKVLVVTSVSENEGKSTVAANLAITLAEQSKRVLLVDGDIRRPSQFLIFGMEPKEENELGEYLRGNGSLADVMVPCTRKHMLFMGGKNCYSSSTEMLNSESFFKLMTACRKFVDYVIIDTPPAGIIGDAQIFAHCADAVMIVSRQNYMLAEDINEVMDAFRDKEGKVLGVVLNGVRSFSGLVDSPVGHYYGKYSKYGRYGNYGRSKGM